MKSGQVTISSFHYHTGDPNVLKHKANNYVEEMSSTFEVNILKNLGDTAVLINPRPEGYGSRFVVLSTALQRAVLTSSRQLRYEQVKHSNLTRGFY